MSEHVPNIMIVDDQAAVRDSFCEYFRNCGWTVNEAEDGEAALRFLRDNNWCCDCIILDKMMPKMDGLTFLRALRQEVVARPIPVIVLSAYVANDAEKRQFEEAGASRVFSKPQAWDMLEAVISSQASEQPEGEVGQTATAHGMDRIVAQHEDLLEKYFEETSTNCSQLYHKIKEPLLVVARRWNSWYPSFFDVAGGAYAIVFPPRKASSKDRRNPVTVVDPGFRFLEILAKLGLSVQDMETCVVTHNHPDHIGGVFEYIACRYQTGKPSKFYCNPSTCRILSEFANASVAAEVLPNQGMTSALLDYCDSSGTRRSLEVESFSTDHKEIGWDNDTRGLVFTSNSGQGSAGAGWEGSYRSVILGDTAFNPANQIIDLPALLGGEANTKIVVLHIGSAQLKRRVGGHLYLAGLPRLLHLIAEELEKHKRHQNNKLLVLVSEWGLEHATAQQMKGICPNINGFADKSAIVETIRSLRKWLRETGLDRLTVLPADIGLMVGMETGQVYLKEHGASQLRKTAAENVRFVPGSEGIEYS